MSEWNEVLADKMTSEFYKHNGFGGELDWVVSYTGLIRSGVYHNKVLTNLEEKTQNLQEHPKELELVRHWIYIIKMMTTRESEEE